MTNTDPGEGASLQADNYLAVYGGTSLLDIFYPIGTSYKTHDISFDPNTSWGGVWEQDTDYQLVAYAYTKGGGGLTIQESKNISQVTKAGTGTYDFYFQSPMDDIDYIAFASSEAGGAGSEIVGVYDKQTNRVRVDFTNHNGTLIDQTEINLSVFGHLATPEYRIWRRTA